jgi:feruloyl esterase
MNKTRIAFSAAFSALSLTALATSASAAPTKGECADLARMAVPGARIVASEPIAAGALKVPPSPIAPDLAARIAAMPAFCRVRVAAAPSPDSNVDIEVWLPLRQWNGRLLATGNGGGAGRIAYEMGMVEGLRRGFAVTNTDMGTAPDINSALDHPERWIDFGYRATHEMARIAKSLVSAFYKASQFRAYFAGCSTGGQQALGAAQRYPLDFDGILAGDPGNNRTHVASYFLWNYAALNASSAAKLSPAQWSMVSRAVLGACVGKDGGAPGDRFLTDPRQCKFDPATLPRCKTTANDECLTAPQFEALRKLYAGPVNPRTGERIYAGLTPGSEDQPLGPIMQGDPATWPDQQFYPFRWVMRGAFSESHFDFDHDLDRIDARLAGTLNANTSDLSEFARGGGKLMIYTGLADPAVPAAEVIAYYDRVSQSAGGPERSATFAKLFLVPGMGHCFGGPGVTNIGQPFTSDIPDKQESDALMTLVAWTEEGKAPAMLIAKKPAGNGAPPQERPICAYPALPEYRGGGASLLTSFTCVTHASGTAQPPASRYIN